MLARYGIDVAPIDDTMLISYVLDAGAQHGHGMDELAQRHLGHTTLTYEDIAAAARRRSASPRCRSTKRAIRRRGRRGDLRLWHALKPRLLEERMRVYETLERPLVPVVAEMERHGIKVDRAGLRRLSGEFAQRMAALEAEIHELAGRSFNIGSPKQLGEVLFDELGLRRRQQEQDRRLRDRRRRARGAGGAGPRAAAGARLAPAAEAEAHLHRRAAGAINPETGRVHTSYSLAAPPPGGCPRPTPTCRTSRSAPRRAARSARRSSPSDGHVLLSADYSQIELRILAHMADIERRSRRRSPKATTSTR